MYVMLSAGRFVFSKPIWVTHKGGRGVTIGELLEHITAYLQEDFSEEERERMRSAENSQEEGVSDLDLTHITRRRQCLRGFSWWYGSIVLVDGEGKCALHVATYDRTSDEEEAQAD
jgi:hypothetical protein